MGYTIFMMRGDVFIAHEYHSSVLEAIKRLDPQKTYPGATVPHFAFVQGSYQEAKTLDEALQIWRWLPNYDEANNINAVEFLGEKLGDDEVMFAAVAPFVREGSNIQMAGDDGRVWQWLFCNGMVQKQDGEIIYRSADELETPTEV